jgi:hypothetical protein
MNRPIPRSPGDGSIVLRRGRFYRLLIVANDIRDDEHLGRTMQRLGFAGHDLAVSLSETAWSGERPKDWPEESPPEVAANEQLVRVSGSFNGPSLRVEVDTPIEGEGCFTIWQAWDMGPERAPPPREETTGAEDKPAPSRSDEPKSHTGLFVGVALAAIGLGAWRYLSNTAKLEREQQRYNALEQRADRARMAARIRELMTRDHHSEDDAAAIAAHEAMLRAEAQQYMLSPPEQGQMRASETAWLAQDDQRGSE